MLEEFYEEQEKYLNWLNEQRNLERLNWLKEHGLTEQDMTEDDYND